MKKLSDRSDLSIIGFAALIILVFVGGIVLLWNSGFFQSGSGDGGAKIVAAALGLVGVLATAIVTLVGLMLKGVFERHNLRLKESAEERLQMETIIRAVGLMSTESGDEAPKSTQASVLFALANLRQLDFALVLLRHMWFSGNIDTTGAVWIVDQAIRSSSREMQDTGIVLLRDFANKLTEGKSGLVFPRSLIRQKEWNLKLSVSARETILEVVLMVLLARKKEKWSPEDKAGFMVMLYQIMTEEKELNIKAGAALALDQIMAFIGRTKKWKLHAPSKDIPWETLQNEVKKCLRELGIDSGQTTVLTRSMRELIDSLRKTWADVSAEPLIVDRPKNE